MNYDQYPKLEKKRLKLMKELEERSIESDRTAKDYSDLGEWRAQNYGDVSSYDLENPPEETIKSNEEI